jgi:hypothetical protein
MESAYQELQKTSYSIAVNQAMAGVDTNIKTRHYFAPFAGG